MLACLKLSLKKLPTSSSIQLMRYDKPYFLRKVKNYRLEEPQTILTCHDNWKLQQCQMQEVTLQCPCGGSYWQNLLCTTPLQSLLLCCLGSRRCYTLPFNPQTKGQCKMKSMLWLLPCVPGSCDV